jgi:superfamily II DNA or RNA helicase
MLELSEIISVEGRASLGPGDFVEVRARRWLVEDADDRDGRFPVVSLSCIDDDAQGDQLRVIWDAEVGARWIDEDPWAQIARDGTDDAAVFAAFLRTLKWRTATAADKHLFQVPFRAGIRLDAYQLAPLEKALRLPRVNLLIADDVGLGKTIEAGLVVRELLLRRRIDFVVVAAPPSMTLQWQDEMGAKFGLSFQIIDRERLADLRRLRGFRVNPWATGSRFIISQRLLTDETYLSGMRDILGEFRARALLILDEAHHAAPATGSRYAVDSQFTKAVRDVAYRFEHRLFLTATPHNGHSNSFSSLLEMLDPQRFTRGVPVKPSDLEPIAVRRLKDDLRQLGESFPKGTVEPIVLSGLAEDAPELALARMLSEYEDLRERRLSGLAQREAAQGRLVFSGLQQRLLSSVAAFAKTLAVHRRTLARLLEDAERKIEIVSDAAEAYATSGGALEELALDAEDADLEALIDADEEAAAVNASLLGAAGAEASALRAELAAVDEMLGVAQGAAGRPDARVRWLEKRLREAINDTDRVEERIGAFTGLTTADRREAIKQAFNADPSEEPLRILICTDAAREGINLQTRCYDLIHFDLPWNPARLEQRNGRIERKLQPAPQVFCSYFRYAQRDEDVLLEALVRKTDTIQRQLGSAGQVIAERIERRLTAQGIRRARARDFAAEIAAESDDERVAVAPAEMDDVDSRRLERVKAEIDVLRRSLERARRRVGIDHCELQHVVAVALERAGFELEEARGEPVAKVETFAINPQHPTFARDASWQDAFDDLRGRRRGRRERVNEWRRTVPPRAIAFEPPVLPDGRDADHVVQVHLEHRLVRRLLGRFLSQGFQSGLAQEAASLEERLRQQRGRIEKADASFDDRQLELAVFPEAERRQLRADRAHWRRRLERIERELEEEPARVRASYEVRARRLEPVGLVYLWPVSG